MYYVAYGSNLDVKQMAYRCPRANVVGTGTIQDYKFVFDVHADIRKTKGNNVKVVVWDIDEYDLESLDMYEGYPVIPNNKFVCSKCFNNIDKCNCNADRHRQWIEIDRPIQKTIRILNEKGYKTIYCCSGHSNHDNLYIYFNNRNVPECNLDGVMWDKKHTAMYYWYNPNDTPPVGHHD